MSNYADVFNVSWRDFQFRTEWKEDTSKGMWEGSQDAMWLIDAASQRRYLNDTRNVVNQKCLAVALATPLVHFFASLGFAIFYLGRLVSFYAFWAEDPLERVNYAMTVRAARWSADLVRLILAPFMVVLLELSAIYGIFSSYNGRKLYATWVRLYYERPLIAPCFQPDAQRHFFGGKITTRNAW